MIGGCRRKENLAEVVVVLLASGRVVVGDAM